MFVIASVHLSYDGRRHSGFFFLLHLQLNFFTSFDCLLEISGSISNVEYGSTSDANLEKVCRNNDKTRLRDED